MCREDFRDGETPHSVGPSRYHSIWTEPCKTHSATSSAWSLSPFRGANCLVVISAPSLPLVVDSCTRCMEPMGCCTSGSPRTYDSASATSQEDWHPAIPACMLEVPAFEPWASNRPSSRSRSTPGTLSTAGTTTS